MHRSKAIPSSLRVASSRLLTRHGSTRQLSAQVTHSSQLSSYLSYEPGFSHLLEAHQKHRSSKSSSLLQKIVSNEWSNELEAELEKSKSVLTHGTVIYVLKKLDKDPQKASTFFNWARIKNGFTPSSSVYSFLLRILARKDTMKHFWITLQKMKEQGFYLDEETHLTIQAVFKKEKMTGDIGALTYFNNRMLEQNALDGTAKMVANVVLEAEWSNKVEKELQEMKITVSDNFVIRTLKELRNYPVKALKIFHWAAQCSDYDHNTITYNAVLRVLARHDSVEEFWSSFEEMNSLGYEMDMDTYIKISRQFQKSKMVEDAVKLYEFMMDGPYKPSIQDCNLLLRNISGGGNPDLNLVFRVTKKYEATGNLPSKPIYDGIHRSLTSLGKFDEAENILKVMKNAGFEPDNITYSQLVFGLCKAERLEKACEVLDEMEASGCIPDIKTWTILIQGHCNANAVDRALMCFAKMMEKNLDPDADLLDVLISGFLSQKRINGAYQLLVEMVKQARLRPWQATFKKLIEKLLGLRKFEEAMNLLYFMKKQSYPPYHEPFIQYISKFGTVGDALEFLGALAVKDYPSSATYHYLLKAFVKEGRFSEAQDVLYKCPHHIRTHPQICELFGSEKIV
ncbi:hypothetical protein SLE2022_376700 [Rubroshorea leprosula]